MVLPTVVRHFALYTQKNIQKMAEIMGINVTGDAVKDADAVANAIHVFCQGLGCMGMNHAYGAPADKTEMINLIAQAVDMGYTFFDTAEVYGTPDNPHGNEILVGEALKPYRDKIVLATKFGIHFDMSSSEPNKPLVPDARPEGIRKSVEQSLLRLQTDHIDLYYQHRTDPDIDPEEVAGVMSELMREGKILHWGLSEMSEEYLRRAHAVCPVTAMLEKIPMSEVFGGTKVRKH